MNPARLAPLSPRVWVVLVALWVVTHPWEGLRHDGILYAAQAMLHLRPEVFSGDLFFAYGSQDDYTIFGRLYASAVDLIGLGMAALLLWGTAQAMWVAVAVAWARRLVGPGQVLAVAATAFSLPSVYSGDAALRFAESFLTARSFAEPLALAGVLAAYIGRPWVAAVTLLVSAAFHPLMALPGVLVALLLVAGPRLGPASMSVIVVAPGLAAAALVSVGVFPAMDSQWLSQVAIRSPFVVAGEWTITDWVRVLYPLIILLLVARFVADSRARLWGAVAACGVMGISLSVVSWALDWRLGLQAQTWRFAWLVVWAAPLAALSAAFAARRDESGLRIALVTTVPALALLMQDFWSSSWALPVLHAAVLWHFLRGNAKASATTRAIVTVQAAMTALAALIGGLLVVFVLWSRPDLSEDVSASSALRLAISFLGWVLVGTYLWIVYRRSGVFEMRAPSGIAVSFIVVAALLVADSRSPAAVNLEQLAGAGIADWAPAIPMNSTVLWPEHVGHVWFALERRSYVSRAQLAGIVFSKEASQEGVRRSEAIRRIGGRDAVLAFRKPHESVERTPPARADLERACVDPALGFVVLRRRLGPVAGSSFLDPVSGDSFHLHRCSDYLIGRL